MRPKYIDSLLFEIDCLGRKMCGRKKQDFIV